MNWTHHSKLEFRKALRFVYRKPSELKIFLSDAIGLYLPEIAAPDDLDSLCYETIETAESKFLLDDLYRQFCQKSPRYRLPEALDAHKFADALKVDELNSETSADRVMLNTFNTFLQDFNLSENQSSLRDRLVELARDRALAPNWENEGNLTYLATYLCYSETLPAVFRGHCATYLTHTGHDPETLERKLPTAQIHPVELRNILVKIVTEEIELDDETEVEVWIYAVGERCDQNLLGLPKYYNERIKFGEIPQHVWDVNCDHFDGKIYPIVHYFLPRSGFDHTFETAKITPRQTLGAKHCVVLRTDRTRHPNLYAKEKLRSGWKNRWQQSTVNPQSLAREIFRETCCLDDDRLWDLFFDQDISAFFLNNCEALDTDDYSSVSELIECAVEAEAIALPVVLWSRNPDFKPALDEILDANTPIAEVPDRIRQLRCCRDPDAIGHHLALVWEDPHIPMPDSPQFSAT
jgi:vWA-MoxR associated protein C-terminal domain